MTPPTPSARAQQPLLHIAGVGKTDGQKRRLFADVHFSLSAGECLSITGASGSGKTSLLAMVAGLERCAEGHIERAWRGSKVLSSEAALAHWRGEAVGMVLQHGNLFGPMSAAQNVAMGMRGPTATLSPQQALASLGLAAKAQQRADSLSGGEQRRVALARLLWRSPALLLCDEPTAGLDAAARTQVIALLQAQVAQGAALLLVSHDEQLLQAFDRHLPLTGAAATEQA